MQANGSKSTHAIFTTRRETCPSLHINNVQLPQAEGVKYLGLHLDRRLTWHKHVFAKRKQLDITLIKMYRVLRRKWHITTSNKLLMYKAILKTIWTYDIQIRGTASTSNIEILESFQSKTLHMSVDAPCYVQNTLSEGISKY
jgi:hypothetical protein